MEYRHQLGILRGWLPFLILGVLVAAVPTYLLMSRQTPMYEVSAIVLPERLLPQAGGDFNEVSVSRFVDLSSTWAFLAKRPDVLTAVAEQLGITDSVSDLAKRVDATVDAGTASMTIVARGGDETEAANLANAVAETVALQSSTAKADDPGLVADLTSVRDRLLAEEEAYAAMLAEPLPRTPEQEARLTQKVALLGELRNTYGLLSASLNRQPDGLVVVERATTATADRIAPRATYYALLAAMAGLFGAAAIAFLFVYFDDRVSSPREVKETSGLTTLAAIGRPSRFARRSPKYSLAALREPRSPVAEAFRSLRTNIEVGSSTNPPRSLLVTSSAPSEGKSITAANLAVTFAQAGTRVILIDTDLRRPSLHLLFKLANNSGLTSLLRDPSVPVDNVAHTIAQEENLRVLTSGPTPLDASAMLGSEAMRALLKRLGREADLLVFDSPPLKAAVDATVLASRVDGTVLVIDASRTRKSDVADAVQTLADARAKVLGAVLYRAPRSTHLHYRSTSQSVSAAVSPALDRGDVG